jgi:hypothetical protein
MKKVFAFATALLLCGAGFAQSGTADHYNMQGGGPPATNTKASATATSRDFDIGRAGWLAIKRESRRQHQLDQLRRRQVSRFRVDSHNHWSDPGDDDKRATLFDLATWSNYHTRGTQAMCKRREV